MKTELTRKESRHLTDLGVPKEKAGRKYIIVPQGKPIVSSVGVLNQTAEIYPIFKLEDFLNGEILPKWIVDLEAPEEWALIMYSDHGFWHAGYVKIVDGLLDEKYHIMVEFAASELINALAWLTRWFYGEYLKKNREMKEYTTIHLWGKGMEKYLGNIMLSSPFKRITEEKLKEIVNAFPDKNLVCYCTFE